MKMRLKKIIGLFVCLVMVLSVFTECTKKDSDKVLNFLNYGENIDDETLKLFKKEYGSIRLWKNKK